MLLKLVRLYELLIEDNGNLKKINDRPTCNLINQFVITNYGGIQRVVLQGRRYLT